LDNSNQVLWPSRFEPSKNPVHVKNELAMSAPSETVWAWLIRAHLWPKWYPNSSNVVFLNDHLPDLTLGTKFRWKTFGITIKSTVLEFVPNKRLAWDAHGTGLEAYHAWLIRKTNEGCTVITEETQKGWVARLSKTLRPKHMEQMHQIWLEKLSEKASEGLPPAPR